MVLELCDSILGRVAPSKKYRMSRVAPNHVLAPEFPRLSVYFRLCLRFVQVNELDADSL